LLSYTIDGILTSVVIRSSFPPNIGQLIKISYNQLTKRGSPKYPKMIGIIKPESLSIEDNQKFDQWRNLEGIAIKCSSKQNRYSVTDQQVQLLQSNPKFVRLCTLQEALAQSIKIPAGKFVLVQNGANIYKVCCPVKGNNIYCSCLS